MKTKTTVYIFTLSSLSLLSYVLAQEEKEVQGDSPNKKSIAEELAEQGSKVSDDRFLHGFLASLSVIIVSELGDKTFFIAAIMAMKHPRLTVFAGSILSLAIMHVMASFFGYATTVIPRMITYYLSSFLFAVFGLKMLHEGYHMSKTEAQDEFEEVNEELRKRDEKEGKGDIESGGSRKEVSAASIFWKIFIQAFTMTMLAEWGDRSQLATVILAAREDVYGVCVGGVLGHALCTGLAVLGGRIIATRISVRTVTLIGGAVFLLFAFSALIMSPDE
jgi:putative Ca2+/H+ antiporter (TMEM165/GDT1 family)